MLLSAQLAVHGIACGAFSREGSLTAHSYRASPRWSERRIALMVPLERQAFTKCSHEAAGLGASSHRIGLQFLFGHEAVIAQMIGQDPAHQAGYRAFMPRRHLIQNAPHGR